MGMSKLDILNWYFSSKTTLLEKLFWYEKPAVVFLPFFFFNKAKNYALRLSYDFDNEDFEIYSCDQFVSLLSRVSRGSLKRPITSQKSRNDVRS